MSAGQAVLGRDWPVAAPKRTGGAAARLKRVLSPWVSAAVMVPTLAGVVFAVHYTRLDLPWVAFLTGMLISSLLSMVGRISYAEWLAARRTARLHSVQHKFERETLLRQRAEQFVEANRPLVAFVDEAFPLMLAYFDAEQRCRYHNRAYRHFLGADRQHIEGASLVELLGAKAYRDAEPSLRQVLAGQRCCVERTHGTRKGTIYRVVEQYLPHFAAGGRVCGFYTLLEDVTELHHVRAHAGRLAEGASGTAPSAAQAAAADDQELFIRSLSEDLAGHGDGASAIVAALANDEFTLFCQRIAPLRDGAPTHNEVLVRLREEEENLMPPGAFFPLAEKHGLMPRLDRWVVRRVVEWACSPGGKRGEAAQSVCFINVAPATIGDPDFPRFVRELCEQHGLPAGTLCFEVTQAELALEDAVRFAREMKEIGAGIALSGFGREGISFDLLRGIKVDFLKIDGSIILNVLRDPVDAARVSAISRVAKTIGVRTIAELVEDEQVAAKLAEIGVDFAQGFGISQPQPLVQP